MPCGDFQLLSKRAICKGIHLAINRFLIRFSQSPLRHCPIVTVGAQISINNICFIILLVISSTASAISLIRFSFFSMAFPTTIISAPATI